MVIRSATLSDNLVSQLKSTQGLHGARGMEPHGSLKCEEGGWGGDEMWDLAKIFVVVAICLGVTGGGWAQNRPKQNGRVRSSQPFAKVSVPKTPLKFGKVSGPGPARLKAEVTARVLANCPFRLAASFEGLTDDGSKQVTITAAQMRVTINGKEVPVGTGRVVIATGGPTPPNGADVPIAIVMEIKGGLLYPAGRYGGNLALAVLTGP
jgi:hypothetical protein